MATLDTRIPMSFQSPQINTPNQNRLQALAIQGQEMDLAQRGRALGQQNALAALFQRPGTFDAQGGINPGILPEVARVAPGQVMDFSKAIQGQRKALSDAQMAQLNQAKTQLDLVGRLLGGVHDENSYQAQLAQARQLGIPVTGAPDHYDPNWISRQQQQTLTYQQQMDNFFRQQGIDIQQGRLDLERNSPRGQVVDTAQGVQIVDPRSGVARPATSADGSPVMGERAQKRRQESVEARLSVDSASHNLDRLAAEAKAILDDPALGRITGLAGAFPNIPGGDAANVQAKLETLKSQVGFAVLQAMRDASKTGGALGQVSDRENVMLQNNLAALDTSQSPEAFRKSLQQIIDYTAGVKTRLKSAYEQQYGGGQTAEEPADGIPSITSAADYNAIPSGSQYRDPSGQIRTKR